MSNGKEMVSITSETAKQAAHLLAAHSTGPSLERDIAEELRGALEKPADQRQGEPVAAKQVPDYLLDDLSVQGPDISIVKCQFFGGNEDGTAVFTYEQRADGLLDLKAVNLNGWRCYGPVRDGADHWLAPGTPVELTDEQIIDAMRSDLNSADGGYMVDMSPEDVVKAGRALLASAARERKPSALVAQLQADLTERDQQIDALSMDAGRYRWLRSRDLETISKGGVFAGLTPDNLVLNEETLDQAIDAAMAKPKCRHCGDTGQIMVGRSGQAEDGNAPIMEPCEDCDRGMPDLASRPEERGTPETEPCSGCGTPGWTGACNKCVPY
ncbi:MAG: hypothetical protein E6Q76_09510 [Rhizobium sp.]|nr:MAG: hypothetical protein E6Q76_09510 [Rhizobium sp.]